MRKIYLLLIFTQILFSQKNISEGKIEYEMTLGLEGVVKYDASLLFNSNYTLFQYIPTKEEKLYTEEDIDNGNVKMSIIDSLSHFILIDKARNKTFEHTKSLATREVIVIEEETNEMIWTLKEDTISIGSHLCNKAITNFRGRTYTALYCQELPHNIGPWKFNNLPGTILEVSDSLLEVVFVVKKIIIPSNEEILTIQSNQKVISRKEYLKDVETFLNEFEKRVSSKLDRNVSVKISKKIKSIELTN